MVSSISDSDSSLQTMMMQLMQKMSSADTDGTEGLSLNELSSVDAGDDVGGAAFVKSLEDQFDTLDADGNGELSSEEMANAKPPEQPMGPPPGMNLNSSDNDSDDLLQTLFNSLDTNQDGKVSADELNATSLKNDASDFVSKLTENFSDYDTNSDGSLSLDELTSGIQSDISNTVAESGTADESLSDALSSAGKSLGNLASVFFEKMIDAYKDSGLSGLTSSIGTSA